MLANDAANLSTIESYSINYAGYHLSINDYLPSKYTAALACEKAAAGIGALEWLLFVITLVIFST